MENENIDRRKIDNFINELTALSLKHRIVICGCGCCESPFLYELENEENGIYEYDADAFKHAGSEINWKKINA